MCPSSDKHSVWRMKKATSARLPDSSIRAGTQLWPLSRHLCAGCLSFHVCTGAPESVWVLFVVLANVRRTCVGQKLPVLSRLTAEGSGGNKAEAVTPSCPLPFPCPSAGTHQWAQHTGCDLWPWLQTHQLMSSLVGEIKLFFFFSTANRRNKIAFKSNCAAARTSGFSGIRPSLSCLPDWLCGQLCVSICPPALRFYSRYCIVSLKSKRQPGKTYYCGLVKSALDNGEGKPSGDSGPDKAATFDLAGRRVFVILIGWASQTAVISTCLHSVTSFWFPSDICWCVLSWCPTRSNKRVLCCRTPLYFIHVFLIWSILPSPHSSLNKEVAVSAAVELNKHTCIDSVVLQDLLVWHCTVCLF